MNIFEKTISNHDLNHSESLDKLLFKSIHEAIISLIDKYTKLLKEDLDVTLTRELSKWTQNHSTNSGQLYAYKCVKSKSRQNEEIVNSNDGVTNKNFEKIIKKSENNYVNAMICNSLDYCNMLSSPYENDTEYKKISQPEAKMMISTTSFGSDQDYFSHYSSIMESSQEVTPKAIVKESKRNNQYPLKNTIYNETADSYSENSAKGWITKKNVNSTDFKLDSFCDSEPREYCSNFQESSHQLTLNEFHGDIMQEEVKLMLRNVEFKNSKSLIAHNYPSEFLKKRKTVNSHDCETISTTISNRKNNISECAVCHDFYNSIHKSEEKYSSDINIFKSSLNDIRIQSRHKFSNCIPPTPNGYWTVEFPETQLDN